MKRIAITVMMFVVAVGAASAAVDYRAVQLETAAGFTASYARDVNCSGQVVGESLIPGTDSMHACLWKNGETIDLGVLQGYESSRALGINDKGQIVGYSSKAGTNGPIERAFLWEDGVMTDLGATTNSSWSEAFGINNNGQVTVATDTGYSVWKNNVLTPIDPIPGGTLSYAYDIADNGSVACNSWNDETWSYRPYLWKDGETTSLLAPDEYDSCVARGVNSSGQAIGYCFSNVDNMVVTGPGIIWGNANYSIIDGPPDTFDYNPYGIKRSWSSGRNDAHRQLHARIPVAGWCRHGHRSASRLGR